MEWIVKIEEKANQRILVRFDALNEYLVFIGQYRPQNKQWINFSERKQPLYVQDVKMVQDNTFVKHPEINVELINVDIIQNLLLKTYEDMKRRVEAYEEIDEGFGLIKLIEFKEE
jgi:hypothetical protein